MRVPMNCVREWRSIAPLLPPIGGPGKPRLDDRLMLSGLFYAEACRCSLNPCRPVYWQQEFTANPPAPLAGRRYLAAADAGRRAHRCQDEGRLLRRDPRRHDRGQRQQLPKLARILGPRHDAESAGAYAAAWPLMPPIGGGDARHITASSLAASGRHEITANNARFAADDRLAAASAFIQAFMPITMRNRRSVGDFRSTIAIK